MAKRLHTRLSAGAALVTGIGMMGIASAAPAQAATDLVYTCQTPLAVAPFQVSIDTDAPKTVVAGETLTIPNVTGTVTLDSGTSNAAAGFLSIETLKGTTPAESKVTKNGEDVGATVSTDLVTAPTTFWDSEAGTWTQEGIDPANPEIVLPLAGSGGSIEVPEDATGTYELHAPEAFTSSFVGTTADGTEVPLEIPCTYESGNTVIDTITVTEAAPEPEVDDWFNEPASLPLIDNVFTVEGEATHDGTLSIEVLAGAQDADGNAVPGHVLTTYTMNATAGANEQDFDLVEGADYVRVISQDCIDANGNDGTVAGGCNVVYQAPWAADAGNNDDAGDDTGTDTGNNDDAGDDTGTDTGNNDDTGTDTGNNDDAGDDTGTDAGDDATATPEVPEVVQTDGLTPEMTTQQDSSAALALGGLLIAGAGAGSVLVMRRRAQQH